ncbi:MAG: triple tyrosine motif-containing protein [Bacteroidales bacterium]|nr:triple tyrosine motif-containing protein [Bacteroidales bacterium]
MTARLIAMVYALLVAMTAVAQFPAIRNFGPQDYNAGPQNWQTAESNEGYVFVANNIGLLVYNGLTWDLAYMPNHTNVHAVVCNSSSNRFYVGAFEEFGYFKNNPPLRRATYISVSSLLPDSERRFKDIWAVAELYDGSVAFQAYDRIFVYHVNRNSVETLHFTSRITDMTASGELLYVSTEAGVFTYGAAGVTQLPGSTGLGARHVRGAFADSDGSMIFVTRSDGFYRLVDDRFVPIDIPSLSAAMRDKQVFCMAVTERYIALGTIRHGILAYDRVSGHVHHLNRDNGLRNNTVLDINIDSDSNMWASLDNGLSYIMFDSPFRTIFSDANTVGTGYASMSLGDRLYIGTNQGLYHIPLPGDYSHTTFTPVEVSGLSGQIWTLCRAGDKLLCGADAGAFAIADGRATPIEGLGSTWGFRPYPGRDDLMIASMYDGFAVIRNSADGWRLLTRIDGIAEGTVNFEIGEDGRIWFSHWLQGVYSFGLSDNFTRATDITIYNAGNQLPTDDNNLVTKINRQVYVSAADGFYIRRAGSDSLVKAGWLDRLFPPNGISTRLFETPDGDIWAHRPDVLAYARRQGNTYTARQLHYGTTVHRLQMNLGNLSYLPGGQTVMNQDDGFYVVDPNSAIVAARKVGLEYVSPLDAADTDNEMFLHRSKSGNDSFEADLGQRDLVFVYSIAEYHDLGSVRFSTMVDGYDDDWTPYVAANSRTLTRLEPGDYVFRVRARDTITGTISEDSIAFRVRPAWHETWWARTIFVIVVALILYIAIDLMKRRVMSIISKRREAERQRRERLQELQRLEREKATMIEHNETLNREIKRKSGQLADSDIAIQRKSDVLKDVNERIDQLIASGKDSDAVIAGLRDLRRTLIVHDKEESCWDRMEENFNIIFDDLLSKIMTRYPTVTRNDIRLCSYLRLNMSTKEIATLMNVSERSVESNRYRLRKKLGMSPGQSFQEFFAGIE